MNPNDSTRMMASEKNGLESLGGECIWIILVE